MKIGSSIAIEPSIASRSSSNPSAGGWPRSKTKLSSPTGSKASTSSRRAAISLNPAQDPANAATNRPGFGIADAAGNTRLFIDPGTGNLGVGTNNPSDRVHVKDGDVLIEGGHYRRLKIVSDNYWVGIELVCREQAAGKTWWDAGGRSDGAFTLNANEDGGVGEALRINKTGSVATSTSVARRASAGRATWPATTRRSPRAAISTTTRPGACPTTPTNECT